MSRPGPRPRIAALTLAHGRHDHLTAQLRGLLAGTVRPDLVVVAAMDDPVLPQVVTAATSRAAADGTTVVTLAVDRDGDHLPLAAARNRAAAHAVADGADLLVLLDVDCIPSPTLVERYAEVWSEVSPSASGPVVLCGAVHYLPPRRLGLNHYTATDLAASQPHPARPVAHDGQYVVVEDLHLFWSLSFAIGAADWVQVGGFDEGYRGYGGEDTDFGLTLEAGGGVGYWVGGAPAYHQHHPVDDPPRQHVADIVRNSNRFHERWGFFPMSGWLDAFEAEGLVTRSGRPPRLHLTSSEGSSARSA
ncbi:MAG: galactosyltransferase-related protein [Lapillicoccus sp.]